MSEERKADTMDVKGDMDARIKTEASITDEQVWFSSFISAFNMNLDVKKSSIQADSALEEYAKRFRK